MPEDFDDKTEAPTPRRREEARERGQVVRSPDLTAAVALLGAMIALNYFGPPMLRDMYRLLKTMLSYSAPDAVTPASMKSLSMLGLYALAQMAGPLCLVLMFIAILITFAQVGILFTFHPLQPSLNKINPIAGFSRMFSTESLVKMAISLLKVGIIGFIAYLTIRDRITEIINISALDQWQMTALTGELMFMLGVRMAVVLLILAIFDYAYMRFAHEKKLRMSKQELKEELRRMEGDPLVKERRKRVARQLAMQRMQYAVPKADVVITNPTELAIALKYDSASMSAPKVVAKGAGYFAARIRQIAIQHRVPIIERKPLAQALYKTVEIGQEIPPSFYKAVAEILAYVYELTGKTTPTARSVSQPSRSASLREKR